MTINGANLRESFFQAVSNSTWANFGYRVAANIEGRCSETISELRILSSLHGIGIILLNTEEPSESQILIPARERSDVDWNTINRLATENRDFLEYVRLVRQFYQTGDPRARDWLAQMTGAL